MKTFNVNGIQIKAKDKFEAIKKYKQCSIIEDSNVNDSDKLNKLAYELGQLANYFDRANSASSRNLLAKDDSTMLKKFYAKGLETLNQLKKEVAGMEHQSGGPAPMKNYFDRTDAVNLILDAADRMYYLYKNIDNDNEYQRFKKLGEQLESLAKQYNSLVRNSQHDSVDDSIKDDNKDVKVCLSKERYAVVSTKEWRHWSDDAYADFTTSDYKKAKDYQDRCKYDTIIIDCYNNYVILDSVNDSIQDSNSKIVLKKVSNKISELGQLIGLLIQETRSEHNEEAHKAAKELQKKWSDLFQYEDMVLSNTIKDSVNDDSVMSEIQSGEYKDGFLRVMTKSEYERAKRNGRLATTGSLFKSVDKAKEYIQFLKSDETYVIVNMINDKVIEVK